MAKDDAIGEVTQKILSILDSSNLSADDKKKAVWRAEGQLNKGNAPAKPKKAKAKKSKK